MKAYPRKVRQRWKHSMETTDYQKDERLQWLRYVLEPSGTMPAVSDWQGLLDFAIKQALTGICMPLHCRENIDKVLLIKWIRACLRIENRNKLLNKQSARLYAKLKKEGLRCCILKGQGNAMMYPNPLMRGAGDIDVWVDATEEELLTFVKSVFPNEKESFKHIKFPVFKNTEVDMHYVPLKMYHPTNNRRLQTWIEQKKEEQMTHYVRLDGTETDIAIPTVAFNAVYQLGHILIHVEDKGIGLRQMVDYYYLLRLVGSLGDAEKAEIVETWKLVGLRKLAGAVMWVEKELLGLPEQFLLVEPDEKTGRLLAEDIMEGGNFGQHSSRENYRIHGRYAKKCADVWHLVKLSVCFPREAFFKIISKVGTGERIIKKSITRWRNKTISK